MPYGRYLENEEGVHATISSWRRVDDNMIPPRGKITGSYVNSAFAKTDAQRAGFDEAIVLNQDGHIAEGSAENFFLVKNGTAITPPVTDNILEGITRRTILELLREKLGIPVVERSIDRTELTLADEAFFCGTGVQIAAITRVDHRPIGAGRMGPVVVGAARPVLRRRPRQERRSTATGATPSTPTRAAIAEAEPPLDLRGRETDSGAEARAPEGVVRAAGTRGIRGCPGRRRIR